MYEHSLYTFQWRRMLSVTVWVCSSHKTIIFLQNTALITWTTFKVLIYCMANTSFLPLHHYSLIIMPPSLKVKVYKKSVSVFIWSCCILYAGRQPSKYIIYCRCDKNIYTLFALPLSKIKQLK